jgi:hypothetical protein
MRHNVDTLRDLGVNPGYVCITLDGKEVKPVIAFDEEAGIVERYLRDHEGKAVVRDDKFLSEVLAGEVKAYLIRTPSGEWPHAIPEPPMDKFPLVRSILS